MGGGWYWAKRMESSDSSSREALLDGALEDEFWMAGPHEPARVGGWMGRWAKGLESEDAG